MLNGRVEREAIEKEGFESMMQDAADSPRTWMVRNGGKKSLQNGKKSGGNNGGKESGHP